MEEQVKSLIIGGPVPTAAIYASRANLKPVLYEGIEPGGQLTTTTDVENFPGHPDSVSGPDLMGLMRRQASGFGADIRTGNVTRADLSSRPFHVVIDGEKGDQGRNADHRHGSHGQIPRSPVRRPNSAGRASAPAPRATDFSTAKRTWPWWAAATRPAEEATYLASGSAARST